MSTYVSDDSSDTVRGEDIETVVVVEVELELGGKVTNGSSHEPEEHGGG